MPNANDEYETVSGDGPVLRLLERVRENNSLIYVRPKGVDHSWTSSIIAVNAARSAWRFDGLPSLEGHRLLVQERQCEVETRLDGILVSFQTEIIGIGAENGTPFYQASPPRSVRVYQRRSFFRAPLGSGRSATVTFTVPDNFTIRGRVRDLSQGGLRASFDQWSENLQTGLFVPKSHLVLPDGNNIHSGVEVRFTHHSPLGVSVGARFVGLCREDQRFLARFVSLLDREFSKKNRK